MQFWHRHNSAHAWQAPLLQAACEGIQKRLQFISVSLWSPSSKNNCGPASPRYFLSWYTRSHHHLVQFVLIRALISAAMVLGVLGKHGAFQGAVPGWAANASKLAAGTAATAPITMGSNAAIPRSSFYNWWLVTTAAMESLDKDASRTPKSLVPLGHIKGDMKVCSIKCPKRPCAMPQEQPLRVTLQSRVG